MLGIVEPGVALAPRLVEREGTGVAIPSVVGGVMENEGVLARRVKSLWVGSVDASSGSLSIEGSGTSGSKSKVLEPPADFEALLVEEDVNSLAPL
jgi:hypothetical protein